MCKSSPQMLPAISSRQYVRAVPQVESLCRVQPTQHSPPLDPFAYGRWLSTMNKQPGVSEIQITPLRRGWANWMGLCKVGGARRLLKHRLIPKFIILFPVVQEGVFFFFQTSSVWFLMRILAGPGDHFVAVKKKKIMLIRTAPYPNPTKTNLDQPQSISTYFLVPSPQTFRFFLS